MVPAPAFSTLHEQLEHRIRHTRLRGVPDVGTDWWQVSEADLAVFEIDIPRWPRMILGYHCYEAFKGIVDADWNDALIAAAVRH